MAILTGEEYIESLRRQKPKVYIAGERVENIVDHPLFKTGINSASVTYQVANDPKYQDSATLMSPLINDRISQWTHIIDSKEDAIASVRLFRQIGDYLCLCPYRCITSDLLNTAWAISHTIDEKYNTNYHQRVIEIVKEAQRKDWIIGGTIVDPKGDRSLPPGKQTDPDMYLHIVEKRKDGIVVRGAKAHATATPYTNMLCAIPSGPLREEEKDYAVAFFTPVDTEGITFICRPGSAAATEPKEMSNPLSSRFGAHVEAFTVYNDVFVPWERVFLCGEYEFAGPLLSIFSAFHILHKCGCRSAATDTFIGATALVADYNGVSKATHIRNYLAEMVMDAEIIYSCGIAAAVEGSKHDSGVYVPKLSPVLTGKVYAANKLGEHRLFMQDTAGGLVRTMATDKDYKNPETGKYMEKYLKARDDVPTEHRIRAIRLIEDLAASDFAGWYHAMAVSGGGGPQMMKTALMFDYDLDKSKKRAKIAAGID